MESAGLDSRLAYTLLIALVAVERGIELTISSRNTRRALARGAIEAGREDYRWMVALHATFLVACPLEVWWLNRPWRPALGIPMLLLLAATMAIRYWVVRTLGGRWTTRAVFVPGDTIATTGPYRYLRHPNYAAVVAEIVALPLVHSAWVTALLFSLGNALVLRRRIKAENALLEEQRQEPDGR